MTLPPAPGLGVTLFPERGIPHEPPAPPPLRRRVQGAGRRAPVRTGLHAGRRRARARPGRSAGCRPGLPSCPASAARRKRRSSCGRRSREGHARLHRRPRLGTRCHRAARPPGRVALGGALCRVHSVRLGRFQPWRARPRGTAFFPGCGRSSRPAIGVMARRAAAIAAPPPIGLGPVAPRRATPGDLAGAELRGQGIRAARKAAAKLMKERAFVRRRQRRPDRWCSRWQLRGHRRAISVRCTGAAAFRGRRTAGTISGSSWFAPAGRMIRRRRTRRTFRDAISGLRSRAASGSPASAPPMVARTGGATLATAHWRVVGPAWRRSRRSPSWRRWAETDGERRHGDRRPLPAIARNRLPGGGPMSGRLKGSPAAGAMRMALRNRRPGPGPACHSGRAARPRRPCPGASRTSATACAATRAPAAGGPSRQGSAWPPRWPHGEYRPRPESGGLGHRALGAAMRNGHLHCSAGFRGAAGPPVPSRSGGAEGCRTEVDRKSVQETDCRAKGTDQLGSASSGRFAARPFASGLEPVAPHWLTPAERQLRKDLEGQAVLDFLRRGNHSPDDLPGLLIHHAAAGRRAVRTAQLPTAWSDRTSGSATRAASKPRSPSRSDRWRAKARKPRRLEVLLAVFGALRVPSG